MIEVEIDDQAARDLLNELKTRMGDLTPVLEAVGGIMQSGTQQRFVDQQAPDGTPWAALSQVTLDRRRQGGRGAEILRDTGRLMNSISYRVAGDSVSVFTNVIYAGTHQSGASKGAYGVNRRGSPIPWGTIPARPFLGYNQADNDAVLEILNGYLQANEPLSWWQRGVDRIKRFFR
jgi:phage virion morphogenesis protein